jgi:hypothetical protein
MRRLQRVVLGMTVAFVATGMVDKSFAVEPGDFTNFLRGGSIGLPLGAAPPPGLYTGLETAIIVNGQWTGNQGIPGTSLRGDVFAGVVPLVWSTGYNIFGGALVLDAVQAFYTASLWTGGNGDPYSVGARPLAIEPVVANTAWDVSLSWNLGQGLFFGAGFDFVGPDGTQWKGGPNPDYWSFQPHMAFSYLANNWLLSANFYYDFNTASRGVCCALAGTAVGNGFLSGQELYLDATAVYRFGKWRLGPVAYLEDQITQDRPGGGIGCTYGQGGLCGKVFQFAVGGLVGYDFGPVDIQVWVTDTVICANEGGCGLTVWTRTGFKLWGPELATPPVVKN